MNYSWALKISGVRTAVKAYSFTFSVNEFDIKDSFLQTFKFFFSISKFRTISSQQRLLETLLLSEVMGSWFSSNKFSKEELEVALNEVKKIISTDPVVVFRFYHYPRTFFFPFFKFYQNSQMSTSLWVLIFLV